MGTESVTDVGYFVPAYRQSVDVRVWQQAVLESAYAQRCGFRLVPSWNDVNGVDRARNLAVAGAKEAGLRWLVMQDQDVWSTAAWIVRAVDIATCEDASVVAAVVPLRRESHDLNVYPYAPNTVYSADMIGTGLMLLDLDRIDLPMPWFERHYTADGTGLSIGGDVGFCVKVKESGGKIVADSTILTEHGYISTLTYNPDENPG